MMEKLEAVFEDARELVEWLGSMQNQAILPSKDMESVTRMVEQELARRIIGILQQKGG